MSYLRSETPDLAGRFLARFVVLATTLLLVAPAGAGPSDGDVQAASQCRMDSLESGKREAVSPYPSLDASIPGLWRQEVALDGPYQRVPGTLAIQPHNPAPAEVSTAGRWVPGYRPATQEARAEFEAWKKRQNSVKAGVEGSETPRSPSSNYAANLISGERVRVVPEEPITRTVRTEKYPVYPIDVREIVEIGKEKPKAGGPADEYHHGSSMTWNEYLMIKELAKTSPATPDGQRASTAGLRAPGFAGVEFDAIQSNISSVPPDPIMAAGPTHLVAIVNTRYQVWDKSGNPLISDIPLSTFFDGVPNCDGTFDVFVDYDEAEDRFVMGGMALQQTAGTDSYLCVAATATNDPTGAWNRFSFRSDANATDTWIDFPHMGIGLENVYISGNMFLDAGGLGHVRLFALDKADLYNGTPLSVAEASLGSLFFTAQPVKIHGFTSGGWPAPGTPHHFISHDAGGNSRIWRWGDPFTNDPVVYGTIAEENFGGVPPNSPELGGTSGDLNDSGSAKWLDAEYRGGKLWTTRNVACDFDGGDSESCIDWIQVDVSGPTPVLEQQQIGGAYGSADEFRYYPDIAVDRNYSIAIGYTKSSWSAHTEVWITGREVDDAAGTLQAETLQRAGLGNYTDGTGCGGSCDRWGDYTGMTVDPDGCTFWYLGQYSDGGYFNWGTHIGSFRFDSCSVDSSVQVDKGSVTCDDSIAITVADTTPIDAVGVSSQTTITTSGGDTETIPAGSWIGSACGGSDCGSWTASIAVSGGAGSSGDGTINVNDGETITVTYLDPHAGHDDQARNVAVACRTRLEDGGYLVEGGCEQQQGGEYYRDYMDGGELISYTFGIYNPPTAFGLTDVEATLSISGPAAGEVTVYNPTVYIGSVDKAAITGPVFQIYIDPGIDAAGFRMSEHDFNLSITSAADGLTVPQVLTQSHLLQADDNIVTESQCWNFESGDQGFVSDAYYYDYACVPPDCGGYTWITSVQTPWTHGSGCDSETRDDHPDMTCDIAGANAFMTNADPAVCNTFTQSATTYASDVLYSPIFGPVHIGSASNGQPWYYDWEYAEWFYRSDMISDSGPAMGVGFLWDPDYPGGATPGGNEINSFYPFFTNYFSYANQGWDSATPWDPANPLANVDGIAFGTGGGGQATPDNQWRWAVHVYDTDVNGNPETTPATGGLALDNMNLVYQQYHTDEQVGSCLAAPPVVALGRYTYLECPGDDLAVSVLDANAAGSVRVTVVSVETGDSETFWIPGTSPYFAASLPYSTAAGPRDNDGTLFVTPADLVYVAYDDGTGTEPIFAFTRIVCEGGDVEFDGVVGLADNGDGDSYADTNESVDLSIQIRNNTGQVLENVRVVIATDDPAVDCVTKDSATIGTIAAHGGTASNNLVTDPFTFKIAGTAECANPLTPPTASFEVLILADDFSGPLTPQKFTMVLDLNDLPGSVTFLEDFTTEPVGFNHQRGPGDDDGAASSPDGLACSPYVDEFFWRASGGNSNGAYFCWQDPADEFPEGTYSDLNDSVLYSPVVKIGANTTTLSFDHEYLFAYSGSHRIDGARVDYSVNGGTWQKMTTLPYDGGLIWNTYCNPLCNAADLGQPCFTEEAQLGENVFNQLSSTAVDWTSVSGDLTGLSVGDLVQFRWRVGSMNGSAYGISTQGGYGLDNVGLTNVVEQVCDTALYADVGCGLLFDGSGNLVEICGDGDTLVEPRERWSVDVTLRNSAATVSVDAEADLWVSGGSIVSAAVTNNPGSYGSLAAAGGAGTASYEFVVDSGAVCIRDILFDVVTILDDGGYHSDQPSAFTVQVGGVSAEETATQSVDPLIASGDGVSSTLVPALTTATPVNSAIVHYEFGYSNAAPEEIGTADTDPLVADNEVVTAALSPPFTFVAEDLVSAVVDWSSLTHQSLTNCTRVSLHTPGGFVFTLKDAGEDAANPYDVQSIYGLTVGGPGEYRIGLEELGGGQCRNEAVLTGATMTLTGPTSAGTWNFHSKVTLWDGTTEHVLKGFGDSDDGSHDVTSIYNASGPGGYELRLEESGAGGVAQLSSGSMTVEAIECDLGCSSIATPAPPVADGVNGTGIRLSTGATADELLVTLDTATCSSSRAVMVYGNLGDYSGYQGAVGSGCDLGTGPTATVMHAGDDVWFNVIWVNEDDAAGHPGYDSSGSRSWDAAGMCGVVGDDPADAVCD